MAIPVIDVFAGPGGLGEGFSSFQRRGHPVFQIHLSIEKDPDAHKTLELRSLFRHLPDSKDRERYYQYLAGDLSRESLFASFPQQAIKARKEAWNAELGNDDFPNDIIDQRIISALAGR